MSYLKTNKPQTKSFFGQKNNKTQFILRDSGGGGGGGVARTPYTARSAPGWF